MAAEGQEAAPKAKRRRSVGNLGGVAAYGFYRSVEWKLAVPTRAGAGGEVGAAMNGVRLRPPPDT